MKKLIIEIKELDPRDCFVFVIAALSSIICIYLLAIYLGFMQFGFRGLFWSILIYILILVMFSLPRLLSGSFHWLKRHPLLLAFLSNTTVVAVFLVVIPCAAYYFLISPHITREWWGWLLSPILSAVIFYIGHVLAKRYGYSKWPFKEKEADDVVRRNG